MLKGAVLSECQSYRYLLTRTWEDGKPHLPFLMLNPSTADDEVDDPTIRRCVAFGRREEGVGGIVVANLYAFRATKPKDLWAAKGKVSIVGPENEKYIYGIARDAIAYGLPVVCAWGAAPVAGHFTIQRLKSLGARPVCLGRTKSGAPRHPLYVRGDQPFEDL